MSIKDDFPIFKKNKALVYLDSAATTQKPNLVIEEIIDFYKNKYASIHRGLYKLSIDSTDLYDKAREKIASFIKAPYDEVVFTKGTTESINLVASSFSDYIKKGDEIIISETEHHSNLICWQELARKKEAILKVIPIDDGSRLRLDVFKTLLTNRTVIVAVCHVSNVTGMVSDIKSIAKLTHSKGAYLLVDGAQAVSHMKVDVKELDVDFYAFSAHKLYGPTGIGVLYGKKEILNKLSPYQFGGDMVEKVDINKAIYLAPPFKFEAGTTPFVQAVGFAKAIEYVESIGIDRVKDIENKLLDKLVIGIQKIEGIRIFGEGKNSSILSFLVDGISIFDIATFLAIKDIAIRVGKHCAEPFMNRFKIDGTLRVSFGVYNEEKDVDIFLEGLKDSIKKLK